MIEVDISNIWGEISLRDLLGLEKDVFQAHMALTEAPENWMNLPGEGELAKILAAAEEIRESSDVVVCIGDDGTARGVTQLLGNGLEILFAEAGLSTRSRHGLLRKLEGKQISLCVCSEDAFWDCLTLRELKWTMERRYGTDEAHSRIHRDPDGLITMAAAGVDIRELAAGMEEARKEMDLRSYENPAWLYAAARQLMAGRNRRTEQMIVSEPDFADLGRWWRNCFRGEITPVCARMPGDVEIRENGNLFVTALRCESREKDALIGDSVQDPGGLNFLAGKSLEQVEAAAWDTLAEAYTDLGIPVIGIGCREVSAHTLGGLLWFFRLAGGLDRKLAGEAEVRSFGEAVLENLGKPVS